MNTSSWAPLAAEPELIDTKLAKNTAIAAITTGVRSGATSITRRGPRASQERVHDAASRPMPGAARGGSRPVRASEDGDRDPIRNPSCGDGRRDRDSHRTPDSRTPGGARGEGRPGTPERAGAPEDLPRRRRGAAIPSTPRKIRRGSGPRRSAITGSGPTRGIEGEGKLVGERMERVRGHEVPRSRGRGNGTPGRVLDPAGALRQDDDASARKIASSTEWVTRSVVIGPLAPDPLQLQVQTDGG